MNTEAIYTIHERGKEFYFFSEYAGGFSYPFATADFLNSLKYALDSAMSPQKDLCVSPLLNQMVGDYHFPEEAKDKEIFSAIEKELVFAIAEKNEILFSIEIDMEEDTVTFHFKEDCEELKDYSDIVFPRRGEPGEYGGESFYCAADNLKISDMMGGIERPISEANEEAYGEMVKKAVQEQAEEQTAGLNQQM